VSVHLKCDRCGAQEETDGMVLFVRLIGPGVPKHQVPLPDGWSRPTLPNEDGSADERELCPACKADLFRFMDGQPVIDMPLPTPPAVSPKVCRACGHVVHVDEECRELTMPGAPGDVDYCGCAGVSPTTDAACPTCGPTVPEPHPRLPVQRCRNCKEHLAPDLGTGSRPPQICPFCGHLRHSTRCPDHISEVGPCGCMELTPRDRMKELGIDD